MNRATKIHSTGQAGGHSDHLPIGALVRVCRTRACANALIFVLVVSFLGLLQITSLAARTDAIQSVDLELVLAVDTSLSMSPGEQRLQRDGYIAAFLNPILINAMLDGPNGRIAVTYLEWAGNHEQSVIVPWQIINTAHDAKQFANQLKKRPITRAMMTSISAMLRTASTLFDSSGVHGLRRVIDVSGDGPNNDGMPVEEVRNEVVRKGIVINGLTVQLVESAKGNPYMDIPDLDRYYADCVIGGPGAFVLSIDNARQFAYTVRQKMLIEIAGVAPIREPQLIKAGLTQHHSKYDCLIGEKLLRKFLKERWH